MATIGTVNVKITGDITGLVAQLKAAGLQVEGFDKKVRNVGSGASTSANAQARGFSNLARAFTNAAGTTGVLNSEISILASSVGNVGLIAAGAGIGVGVLAAGLGASVASAISFESAITKVAKTANLSKEETKAFGDEILAMSRRLPVATSDLTKIAEVAGQLGIQGTANIARFVEEIAKLNSTTGVASDVLASGLGTLVQVSGLPIDAIDNISASLTNLGNTSNSTETQILEFATRLAGIGTSLNVPIADILSIGSSFAAAGVPAERGGTAIQNILISIAQASEEGGDKLALFADVAGLTVDQFQKLQDSDPGIAFTKVVEGFGQIGNVLPVLEALEIADDRLVAAALAAANAQGGLTAPLLANRTAAIEATATNEEFARSSETTAAKIQLLKNNISTSATEIGTVFLPAVNLAIDGLNSLFEDFNGQNFSDNLAAMGDSANAFADTAGSAFTDVVNAFQTVDDKLANLQSNVEETYNMLRDVPGTGPIYALVDAFDALAFSIANVPRPDLGGLGGFLGGAISGFKGAFGGRVGSIPGPVGQILTIGSTLGFLFGDNGNAPKPPQRAVGDVPNDLLGIERSIRSQVAADNRQTDRNVPIPPGLQDDGGGSGGAGAKGLTALEAAMDGIITRSEALTLGLTDAQVIALELAVAENRVADEEFRRRIELQALAAAYPGLTGEEVKFRLGLEAIAEHLKATGKSIEQFILETSTTLLEGFQSAFAAIFNKPTKEDSALQLQLLEAQRRKLLLGGGGSESQKKAIDAEIERLQNLIAIRQNADEITKTRAEIADNTALTDQAQATAAELYIKAIDESSEAVADMTGIVFLQTLANIGLKDQTLSLTTAFARLNDEVTNAQPSGAGLSLADALVALAGLPDQGQSLLPGAALGMDYVPRDMDIRVHRGERIVPAFRNQGEAGQTVNVITYITADSQASQESMEKLARMVEEKAESAIRRAAFRGSYVTSGAYTPS